MFHELFEYLLYFAFLIWGLILVLPWRPWGVAEQLDPASGDALDLSDITVVIPARNEAAVIEKTLAGLELQGEGLKIILVNDSSEDHTREIALGAGLSCLKVLDAEPLPPGWSGKLWAQQQGVIQVDTPLTLLIDADVRLDAGIVAALLKKIQLEQKDFVSLMAMPPLYSWWEKLLMPAFVYFFKMLYPFSLSNKKNSFVATAAGGCILVKTAAIDAIGGIESIKDALIDDCTLARKIKKAGYPTWMGLTRSVHSQRPYSGLEEIWNMVARTAFTQLLYSNLLLGLCVFLMVTLFIVPVVGVFCPSVNGLSALVLLMLCGSYIPMVCYYRLSPLWALTLPVAALLYLLMTITSARRYWRGEKSRWKGRQYQVDESAQ